MAQGWRSVLRVFPHILSIISITHSLFTSSDLILIIISSSNFSFPSVSVNSKIVRPRGQPSVSVYFRVHVHQSCYGLYYLNALSKISLLVSIYYDWKHDTYICHVYWSYVYFFFQLRIFLFLIQYALHHISLIMIQFHLLGN